MRSLILLLASTIATTAAVPPAELDVVRQLLADRKLADAESAAQKLTQTYPQEGSAFVALGTVQMGKEDPDAAVAAFLKATTLDPKSSEFQRRLGDAYGFAAQKAGLLSKIGLAKKCLAAYENAVALDPWSISARQSLMGYYQAAPGVAGGGIDKAHAQADEIIKLDPARGRIAKATLYSSEKKYDEAFGIWEQVLKESPTDYGALYQFGRTAAESGLRLEQGRDALQRCLQMTPPEGSPGHAAAHWRIGNIFEKLGDKKSARTAYETSLKLDPKFTQAANSLKKLG